MSQPSPLEQVVEETIAAYRHQPVVPLFRYPLENDAAVPDLDALRDEQ